MTAPSFTYSGNVYTGAAAGTVDFALTSTAGNAIAYLDPSHIHVYKSSNQGLTWTELTRPSQWDFVTSGTVARLVAGIATGDWVKVQRITPSTSSYVTFQASSLLTAEQLNDDTLFNTYLNQERLDQGDQASTVAAAASTSAASASSVAASATTTANTASAAAAAATTTANTASASAATALSQSNTAITDSAAALSASANAVTTANTAATNAASAVTTAGTASTNASAAVNTANTAASNASTALSQSTTALANSATALSAAGTASTNSATALSTANSASSLATSATNTANTASTLASTAVATANDAETKADQAIAAVSSSINYQLVANVGSIPTSPANNTYIEVGNSTGLESFSPLAGLPGGFVGDSGLSARLRYTTAGSTWNFLSYYPNNAETRYLKLSGGTLTGNIILAGAPSSNLHPATKAYVDGYVSAITGDIASLSSTKLDSSTAASTYQTQAGMSSYLTTSTAGSTYAPLNSPTFTGVVTIPAGASISGYLTSSAAASTYQTQSGMSSYLTTATASSTYAPLASPTFTGTVTIPAGAAISGYLTSATAASTYQTQSGMSSYLTTATASSTYQPISAMSSYLTTATALSTYQPISAMSSYLTTYATTSTGISKTLANRERCTVTASGLTITLPSSPSAGWEVSVTVAGSFTDTTIARNGSNVMSLAEDMTIDRGEITVTLYYVDATRGWRII